MGETRRNMYCLSSPTLGCVSNNRFERRRRGRFDRKACRAEAIVGEPGRLSERCSLRPGVSCEIGLALPAVAHLKRRKLKQC